MKFAKLMIYDLPCQSCYFSVIGYICIILVILTFPEC